MDEGTMRAAVRWVAITAAALTVVALLSFGLRASLGVLGGGVIATANLYVFGKVGEAFLSKKGNTAPWTAIALIKLVGLLGGVWLVLRTGAVAPIALAVGYAALPAGITLGSLFGPKPDEGGPGRSLNDDRRTDVLEARPRRGSPTDPT